MKNEINLIILYGAPITVISFLFLFFTQTAKLLGFDNYIPPYASTNGDQLLTGVNFASAAAGIREETGQQLVRSIWGFNFTLIKEVNS